jgi:hypothetical protein
MSEPTPPRILCRIERYGDLLHALRTQLEKIQIWHEVLDEISGATRGLCGKLLSPTILDPKRRSPNSKRLSFASVEYILPALGVQLALVEDEAARSRYQRRWQKKQHQLARTVALGPSRAERRLQQRRRAGKARMAQMSRDEHIELSRRGGLATAKALSKNRRRRNARHAAKTRWSRRGLSPMPTSEKVAISCCA